MGYGLEIVVPLLVNRDPSFDAIVRHYHDFDLETGEASGMDLMVFSPPDHSRFGTFLELIQNLERRTYAATVVVVNHGMSDANDRPLGLLLPLTAQAPAWHPEEYTLGLLADFMGSTPSDADYAGKEQNSLMKTPQGQERRMPPGTLKPLDLALKSLRSKQRRLQRLELRACNLGSNRNVMGLLGGLLGIETVVAPDVHMFVVGLLPPGPLPLDDAGFARWQSVHPRARIFTEQSAANPRRVGIQINGKHAHRTMEFATTNVDVTWFVDRYCCPGGQYFARAPGKGARVAPFSFAGMDHMGSFVLGQEAAYEAHLVEEFPCTI